MSGKSRKIIGLSAIVVLVFIMVWGGRLLPALADSSPSVRVSIKAPAIAVPGSNFTATVEISQVEKLDACNYDVCFYPAVLRLDNVTSGNISGTVIPVDKKNEISSGTYRVVQNIPGLRGVTGSGYLAVLHFRVVASQSQSIEIYLSNGTLASTNATAIPATWPEPLPPPPPAGTSGGDSGQGSSSEAETSPGSETESASTPSDESTPASESEEEAVAEEPGQEQEARVPGEEATAEEEGAPQSGLSAPPQSETASVAAGEPTSEPPGPPSAPLKPTNWPLIWGGVGGAVIVFGLIIFFWVRRRAY